MKNQPAQVIFVLVIFFALARLNTVNGASDFIKYPGNPVFQALSTNWDDGASHHPMIIRENTLYKMWYEGNGGYGWRIGYATSSSGLSNWIRTPQPVIEVGSFDTFDEMDTTEPFVLYNPSLGLYQMWYSSMSTRWVEHVPDRFRLRYATSSDGINWTRYNLWVLKGTPGKWDSGGIARGLSVIIKDNVYHMWYSATNEFFNWNIGYATSEDGINWTKQNGGEPVVTATEPWERNWVSMPNVTYRNEQYEMYYTASYGDPPQQIVFATSPDGINWSKPADKNPVLTPGTSGSFDSTIMTSPFALLLENGTTQLWYGGNTSAIGFATNGPIPSPTPSPSPTPTPLPTEDVILIPGVTASWNSRALLGCEANAPGDWSLLGPANSLYTPLLDELRNNGWTAHIFPYDWRKPVAENAQSLKAFINERTVAGERVHLIGHSMGGLLARSYIEQEGEQNKVDKFITVGTPHKGSVNAYLSWSGGVIPPGNPLWRFLLLVIQKSCTTKTGGNDVEAVHQYTPSVRDLLPTFDYLIDNATGLTKSVSSMNAQNTWLTSSTFTPPYHGVTAGTLSGDDHATLRFLYVNPPTPQEQALGKWLDGKPVQKVYSTDGDDTVLSLSSSLEDADNRSIPQNHTEIVSSSEGIGQIIDFLNGASTLQAMMNATSQSSFSSKHKKHTPPVKTPTTGLFVIGYPAKLWIIDPRGKLHKDEEGLISVMDPKAGFYKLIFWPKERKSQLIVAQILENDQNLWREYTVRQLVPYVHLPRIYTLKFNASHPKEDILH